MKNGKKRSSKKTAPDTVTVEGVVYYAAPPQQTAVIQGIDGDMVNDIIDKLNAFCKKEGITGLASVQAVMLKKSQYTKDKGNKIAQFLLSEFPEVSAHVQSAQGVSEHAKTILVYPLSVVSEE